MASTFDALAWEIELAGARCISLDSLIGALLPTMPAEHREQLMESMQAVDLLAQHLTGLSAFARRMSLSVADDVSAPVDIALAEITLGALARNESRGAHYKPDYPERDDANWLKTTKAKFVNGQPVLEYEPVDIRFITPRKRDYSAAGDKDKQSKATTAEKLPAGNAK